MKILNLSGSPRFASNDGGSSDTTQETEPEEEVYEGGMKWSLGKLEGDISIISMKDMKVS